jgi:hypothetical protein
MAPPACAISAMAAISLMVPQRIAGRLDVDEFGCPRLHGSSHRIEVRRIDEIDAVPEARRIVHQPMAECPIHHV